MSESINGTNKRPDGGPPLPPIPTFEAGDPVPGLSSWLLERKLGGGGFGEVWLAKHALRDERPRAVKFCLHPEVKNRLVTHEKNVVARVMKYAGGHPNVVPLLEYNLDGDIPWLMYEYVEGGTLAGLIGQWKQLPLPKRLGRAVQVLHAVAGALGRFHRFNPPLVHRDMKPANVLMAGSVPRITDFGIGSVVVSTDGATGGLTALAARLPSALHNAGTRLYAPAEQMLGAPPHPRDDVYALGIIAYQMVKADLTTAPGTDATWELRDLKVPGEFASLIVRSVAVNPDRRPGDATEWASVLAGLVEKAQKRPETATSGVGSKPVLLPNRAEEAEPPFATEDVEVPSPPPTAGPSARTGTPPLPLPLPPSESPPVARPVARPGHKPTRPEPKSFGRRKGLALGSVLLLGLVAAVILAALPSGKRSDSTQPNERVERPPIDPKTERPKGDVPETKGGTNGGPPEPKAPPPEPKVGVSAPKAGETRDIEIAPGVKMTFCWIPAGECQLGSPKTERDLVLKLISDPADLERLASEAEEQRGKFKTTGFWLGKNEVTQAEWKAVMGDNPSYPTNQDTVKGMDTSRVPVVWVSWNRICGQAKYVGEGFLDKIDHGGIERAMGTAGRFKLPHEDEWEYACRGGRGNTRAFFWGDSLNGTEANCAGEAPFGTTTNGPYLQRMVAVDFTNDGKYERHPWGLMHMHGNVSEWCENLYKEGFVRRVLRGGPYYTLARYCRAACRDDGPPGGDGASGVGFRLIISRLPQLSDSFLNFDTMPHVCGTWHSRPSSGTSDGVNIVRLPRSA